MDRGQETPEKPKEPPDSWRVAEVLVLKSERNYVHMFFPYPVILLFTVQSIWRSLFMLGWTMLEKILMKE